MSQEQQRPEGAEQDTDETPVPTPSAEDQARRKELTDDVDDLLGELDGVLEENAEEFVRGYVQKGGQ